MIEIDIRGQHIRGIARSPWVKRPGFEMPGVAGPDWYYCDIYITLDRTILKFTDSTVTLATEIQSDSKPIDLDVEPEFAAIIGVEVLKLVSQGNESEPEILLMLATGQHLENAMLPGGSKLMLGSNRIKEQGKKN